MSLLMLSACTEDIEDTGYRRQQSLKIQVFDANDSTKTRATYSAFPAVTFESGDQIGVYAVNGTTVVSTNIPFTFDGTEWTSTTGVGYNENCTYYAYYPYVASPYTPNFSNSTINSKFSTFITDASNKFHYANQSTKANFNASDLMIAQGTVNNETFEVSFIMYHKKGLAVFDGNAQYTTFTGNIPFLVGTKKYFLMKPSTATTFNYGGSSCSLKASSGKYTIQDI